MPAPLRWQDVIRIDTEFSPLTAEADRKPIEPVPDPKHPGWR